MLVVPMLVASLMTIPLDGRTVLSRRKLFAEEEVRQLRLERPFEALPPKPTASHRVLGYYAQRENYNRVTRAVFQWYGTRRNGCVAFMSEALRQSGYYVPRDVVLWGENVSLQVWGFARFLEHEGWTKVSEPRVLEPGDIVFTQGTPARPNRPAHVFLFAGWKTVENGTGWAIDNQGFTHKRNVWGRAEASYTPMRFAYRAPAN